jgi:nucleoside-diphosphate-sugar epimerase
MAQRVFLTGSGGFVGSTILGELGRRGLAVNALVNRKNPPMVDGDVKIVRADLFDPQALDDAIGGCDTAIHLIGIIMEKPSDGITFQRMHVEATRCVVESAKRAGVKRFIHMSALGVRADAASDYGKTKWQGEEIVRGSGMDWTIFRPSMIHGPRGEFMRMEAGWARKRSPPFLFMPYFGAGILGLGGAGHIQPVYVDDVARAFVEAIGNPKSVGQTYCLGGADRLTWPQMHKIAARAIVGKDRLAMAIPAWYAKMLAAILPGSLLPFNRDQVVMSQEDNTCDTSDFERDFGWKPVGFEAALGGYARRLS